MKAFKAALMLTALMSSNPRMFDDLHLPSDKNDEHKNKHNLTPEQYSKMQGMTPKEKKKFLKGLK